MCVCWMLDVGCCMLHVRPLLLHPLGSLIFLHLAHLFLVRGREAMAVVGSPFTTASLTTRYATLFAPGGTVGGKCVWVVCVCVPPLCALAMPTIPCPLRFCASTV
jgi:hypothetical protein